MGISQKCSEHRLAKYIQGTSADLQLPQKLAAVNQIVLTKVVTNYKIAF